MTSPVQQRRYHQCPSQHLLISGIRSTQPITFSIFDPDNNLIESKEIEPDIVSISEEIIIPDIHVKSILKIKLEQTSYI